ncbi:MAG: VOC family protein [Deltaproteobacteria bacterium]|jgi:lactoylglutathione lyase|nr:VOC family protein [Deltaproteobacteria bacterium]
MKTTLGQYCINVSNLDRAVAFYEGAIGLEITNRIEEENFREVILGTPDGARIQLAYHFGEDGPIEHGNSFWKHYVYTDDCRTLYERALASGGESVLEPQTLERWKCTVAMVKDPDGYQLEIIQQD